MTPKPKKKRLVLAQRQCPMCAGSGLVDIDWELQKTLDFVHEQDRLVNTREVADHFDMKINAMGNRLTTLYRLGFLKRAGGRKKYWWEKP